LDLLNYRYTAQESKFIIKELDVDNTRNKNKEELFIVFKLLEKTYNKVKVPLIPYTVFFFDNNFGIFLICYFENTPITSRIVLPFGNELYDWYAGSDENHLQ